MIEIDSVSINTISYSEMYKFETCQRQYFYRFILNLRGGETSQAVATGVKGHKLLQNFYEYMNQGMTKEEAHELTQQSAVKLISKQHVSDDSLLPAYGLVDNYIRANEFKSKALLIENRFRLPASMLTDDSFFADLEICFTPDLVVERTGGFLDVEDNKFVQRAWSAAKIRHYTQSQFYQIFLEAMGYKVSRSLIRFFNVKTSKMTTEPYVLTAASRAVLINDFFKIAREVMLFKRQSHDELRKAPRTMNYTQCDYCDFKFPCELESEGKNATRTLQTLYIKSDYSYDK